MDSLIAAITAVKSIDIDNEFDVTMWKQLENSLDSMASLVQSESLDDVLTEKANLPKLVTELAGCFTTRWWAAMTRDYSSQALSTLIAFFRLLKTFHFGSPATALERRSNEWFVTILQALSKEARVVERYDESLVLAMAMADLVPARWLKDVGASAIKTAFSNHRLTSAADVSCLPTNDLRRLLAWACCVAEFGSNQEEIRVLINALDLISDTLPSDCSMLCSRLRDTGIGKLSNA